MINHIHISNRLNKLAFYPITYRTNIYRKNRINNIVFNNISSNLLKNNLIFIGLPFTNSVTELVLHQILYLIKTKEPSHVTFLINSSDYAPLKKYSSYSLTNVNSTIDVVKYLSISTNTITLGKSFGSPVYFFTSLQDNKSYSFVNSYFSFYDLYFKSIIQRKSDLNQAIYESTSNQKLFNNLLEKNLIFSDIYSHNNKCLNSTEALALGIIDNIIL